MRGRTKRVCPADQHEQQYWHIDAEQQNDQHEQQEEGLAVVMWWAGITRFDSETWRCVGCNSQVFVWEEGWHCLQCSGSYFTDV